MQNPITTTMAFEFWSAVTGNLLVACLLGIAAMIAGRRLKRPFIAHTLWVLVLVKLLTPSALPIEISLPHPSRFWAVSATPSIQLSTERPSRFAAMPPLANFIQEANTSEGPKSVQQWTAKIANEAIFFETVAATPAAAVSKESLSPFSRLEFIATYAFAGIFAVWLLAAGLAFARTIAKMKSFTGMIRKTSIACSEGDGILADLWTGHQQPPRVRLVDAKISPMLVGLSRWSIIVCPRGLWDRLNGTERAALLAHELGHFRRGDQWVRWIELLTRSLYWWLPPLRYVSDQIERMEETCADLWASRQLGLGPRAYAEAILVVVDYLSELPAEKPQLATAFAHNKSLEERLRAVMRGGASDEASWVVKTGLAFLAIIVVSVRLEASIESLPPTTVLVIPLPTYADTDESGPKLKPSTGLKQLVTSNLQPRLPAVPKGWWNESMLPSTFEIRVPGSQAVLEVNPNISIDVRTAEGKRFLLSEPRPARLAILGEHGRFVIGNMLGELRVWDSASRQSISLLGSHGSRITSLDYCRIVGLIAADASGQIKRWDTQSGAQLASWRGLDVPVQSARLNAKGNIVAALLGSANRNAFERTLVLLDAEKLTVISTSIVDGKTALVLDIENHWTCVGWNGSVAGVHGDRVSEIPKECVESLLFSPTSELFNTSQPFPHAATAVVQ